MSNSSESPKDDFSLEDDSEKEVDWVESPSNNPGILEHKDSSDTPVQIQSMKKGNWSDDERKRLIKDFLNNMTHMTPPGIKPIKQQELYTKWRPLVPEEYQDDFCPKPTPSVIEECNEQQNIAMSAEIETYCLPCTEDADNNTNANNTNSNATMVGTRNRTMNATKYATTNGTTIATTTTTENATRKATTTVTTNSVANMTANAMTYTTTIAMADATTNLTMNANRRAIRKCGICKKSGHDRRNCPQANNSSINT